MRSWTAPAAGRLQVPCCRRLAEPGWAQDRGSAKEATPTATHEPAPKRQKRVWPPAWGPDHLGYQHLGFTDCGAWVCSCGTVCLLPPRA